MPYYGSKVTATAAELVEFVANSYTQINSFLLQCGIQQETLDLYYLSGV